MVVAPAALASGVPPVGGSSAPPALAFTPSSWTAGPIAPETTTMQTFTLTNTGGRASGALTVTVSGPAAFTLTADTCTGTSLGPDKQCSVTVQYAPTSDGENDTATLTAIGTQAPPVTAPLAGSASPYPKSQADCQALGGTFSTDPATNQVAVNAADFIWSCNNNTKSDSGALSADCWADGAQFFADRGNPYLASSCYKSSGQV